MCGRTSLYFDQNTIEQCFDAEIAFGSEAISPDPLTYIGNATRLFGRVG